MYGTRIVSFRGIGHARKIEISTDSYPSLEGLEDSPLENFSIFYNSERRQSFRFIADAEVASFKST